MDKKARKRKRRNAVREVFDIVRTILLVVIAVAAVVFVVLFIRGELGETSGSDSKMSVFGKLFSGRETAAADAETESSSGHMDVSTEVKDGFSRDSEGNLIYLVEGQTVRDCWLDLNRSLYRADADGFIKTGQFEEDGFIYTAAENGAVTAIRWNENYKDPSPSDMPGLVKDGSLMVWINEDVTMGRFSAITYKKSSVSHLLGGETNPQYTAAGSMQTDGEGYIYWLPVVSGADETESRINRKLYRMLPGAEVRQIVAEDVDGYRVVSGAGGEAVIYYCKGNGMYRCGSAACRDDVTVQRFTEDMEYELDLSTEGKLYLKTAGGYPVTQAFDSFTTGGMTYETAADGQILSRADQIEAAVDADLYSILSDEVFNTIRSVVVREDGNGNRSMISGDFTGECRCIYYNGRDGRLYAEYVYSDGTPYIIMITKDGDVDLLSGDGTGLETMEIYGFNARGVVVKKTDNDGNVSYATVDSGNSSPLALGTEPQPLDDGTGTETGGDTGIGEQYGPGYTGNPDTSESIAIVAPDGSSGPGVSNLTQPAAAIPDEPVTLPGN